MAGLLDYAAVIKAGAKAVEFIESTGSAAFLVENLILENHTAIAC